MEVFRGLLYAIPTSLVLWLCLLLGVLYLPAACAGSFMVSPVRIFMSLRDRAVALEVTNTGAASVTLRAELNAWTQTTAGEDQLAPTDDIVLSPPVLKLAPGDRQVVRLVRLVPANPARQATYRMLLREVREPGQTSQGVGMNIQLVLSIPIFVSPPSAARAIECGAAARSSEAVRFTCANRGSAYAQITGATVTQAGREVARLAGPAYLLPGSERTLAARGSGAPGAAQLVVTFDDRRARAFELALP